MSDYRSLALRRQTLRRRTLRRLSWTAAIVSLAVLCAGGASAQAYDQTYGYAPPAPPPPAYSDSGYGPEAPATAGDVIVHAPRRQETDPATGAPIEWVSASRVVRYDDLDLSQDWGVHELKARVVRAARAACDELDNRYIVTDSDDSACVRSAVRHALYETPIGPGGGE